MGILMETDFEKIVTIAAVHKDANLVELEKCCQTHIFLQNFVLIQPRTSPPKKLQKFATSKNLQKLPNFACTAGTAATAHRAGEEGESVCRRVQYVTLFCIRLLLFTG